MKRALDLSIAFVLLILISPILAIICILIKFTSRGPVFFVQRRIGKDMKEFDMYKFRTMVINAEKIGTGLFSYQDDPRVTFLGKLLRKLSLDELPQLINIIKGDMSCVGPRPPVTYELGNINDFSEDLKKRFSVPPGVTGYAQINGRNDLSWEEKISLDLEYIEIYKKKGVLIDLKIILVTLYKIILMEGSYEKRSNFYKDKSLQNNND